MLETISSVILTKAGEHAVSILADAMRRENDILLRQEKRKTSAKIAVTEQLIRDALARHTAFVRDWSSTVHFSDLPQKKSVAQIYVNVDTYLIPVSRHVSDSERRDTRPLLATIADAPIHAVILGGAGAGKTTALKKICVDFFSLGRALLNYSFPLVIELRQIASTGSKSPIYRKIQEILSIEVIFNEEKSDLSEETKSSITKQVLTGYIDALKPVILLDGYDEIAQAEIKSAVLNDFDLLSKSLRSAKIILTSRSGEFKYVGQRVERYEIASLTEAQIELFAEKWLASPAKVKHFLSKVKASPFADTAIRPLTIAHLCAIYERINDIPDKPKSVYKRVVNLLLKEWDEQRLVKRPSMYAGFDVDRKAEFLAHVAFLLTTEERTLRFGNFALEKIYKQINREYELPERQATVVIEEIESHNGLIVRSGYDSYEFAHKSLQEFLAADYIVRLPSLAGIINAFPFLANELAIATALSSKPGTYLLEVLIKAYSRGDLLESTWFATIVDRLILEKADLAAGHTPASTIAALQLISITGTTDPIQGLISRMISHEPIKDVSRYYKVERERDGLVTLIRRSQGSSPEMPNKFSAPAEILFGK